MQSGKMEGEGVDQMKMAHLNTNGPHISKYGPINKHKGPINYDKTQITGKLETPTKKQEKDLRVWKKRK